MYAVSGGVWNPALAEGVLTRMRKEEDPGARGGLDQDDRGLRRPRALFLLLLLTSFMALAFWALEVRPSLSADVGRTPAADIASN